MSILKPHERIILEILSKDILSNITIESINTEGNILDYQTTGNGYFLDISHPKLPENRIVCGSPLLIGKSDNIDTGYIVFIENQELTIECHGWGDKKIPNDYRERNIEIEIA